MAGISPAPWPTTLARFRGHDIPSNTTFPTFHLVKADILQFFCDAIIVVTDEEMKYDRSTPCKDGGNPLRPGWFSWRIIADGIPIPNGPPPAGSNRSGGAFDTLNTSRHGRGTPNPLLPFRAMGVPSRGLVNCNTVILANLEPNPHPRGRRAARQRTRDAYKLTQVMNTRTITREIIARASNPFIPHQPIMMHHASPPKLNVQKATSIALPLIGGGAQLKYPRTQSAEAILTAVISELKSINPWQKIPPWDRLPNRLVDIFFIVKAGPGWEADLEEKAWKSAWKTKVEVLTPSNTPPIGGAIILP